jgi:hypothetical protein
MHIRKAEIVPRVYNFLENYFHVEFPAFLYAFSSLFKFSSFFNLRPFKRAFLIYINKYKIRFHKLPYFTFKIYFVLNMKVHFILCFIYYDWKNIWLL